MIAAAIGFGALLIILLIGVPLGLAMFGVGYVGLAIMHFGGWRAATSISGQQILDLALNYNFTVLPLFVLMGVFVARAALSEDLYEAAQDWLGHFRGGLAMSTVMACAGFAAVSGSSVATAATMSKVAMPSMRKFGYADWFSTGTIAAGGTIGILVPPSAALIIYGLLTEQDIAKLFAAGLIPGVLTVVLYFVVVRSVTAIWPEVGPPADRATWSMRFASLRRTYGVLALFLLIIGGLFFGVFTATEAGGIGAVGALGFAIVRKKMTLRIFWGSLVEAAETTAMIFAVAFGALVLNQFINLSGMPEDILDLLGSVNAGPMHIVLLIIAIYVVLGMFLDGFAMIFLTVPIFVPVIANMDFGFQDPLIWWGIVLVMVVEISLITPPIGLNVFIIRAMLPDVPLTQIFKGIGPFFLADLIRMALVLIFPALAIWLPSILF
jgi:tripartite ATP-independent transporter DctM subunit